MPLNPMHRVTQFVRHTGRWFTPHWWAGDCVRGRWLVAVAVSCAVLISSVATVRSTDNVDLVLILALDVSHSVNNQEFDLQRIGLAKAFRHPAVIKAIQDGQRKRIAVMAMQWSGFLEQHVSVPWTVISSAADAASFADRLAQLKRRYKGGATHIAGAVRHAAGLIKEAPFAAARQVVDVSGDGRNNVNDSPRGARDVAVRAGITINGLAIVHKSPDLVDYYRSEVIGGPGAFVVSARNYDDFPRAILLKLLREINMRFIL